MTPQLLKKSKFYYLAGDLREHIANIGQYGIFIKQSALIKELENPLDDKNYEINLSLILISDIKNLKPVNGNKVRKINPKSLNKYEKISLIQKLNIDDLVYGG